MNKTFKVIYNKSLGIYVAVSETTKSKGKSTKSVVAGAILLTSSIAFAGPSGGVVVGGTANISAIGNTTTINQATNRAIINWQGFNVGSAETVKFNQPNVSSAILNRVLSANPTLIDGAIKANGNVFIVNSAGVLIGKGANINVGGLTVSSLGINNDDFMAGRYKFKNDTAINGKVLNEGTITTETGGLVALIGGQVNNQGIIIAKEGTVALAAGNAVSLTLGDGITAHSIVVEEGTVDALVEAGGAVRVDGGQIVLAARAVNGLLKNIINQTGVLEANSLTRQGGKIILDGGDNGIVNIAGTVSANGVTGGKIVATGHDVLLSGKVEATGAGQGGEVYIGGGYQGTDSSINHATNVAMTRSATIDVSSQDNGNGGTAVLWSDNSTQFYGNIKATGGANNGNGGTIETSGHNLAFNGTVNVDAPKGQAGNILLDPDIILISSTASGAQDAQLPTVNDGVTTVDTTSNISVAAIEAITSGTVNMTAGGYIRINDLTLNGGDGSIDLKPNVSLSLNTTSNGGSRYPGDPSYGGIGFVNANNSITATGTGAVTLQGGNWSMPGATAASANAALFNIGRIQTENGAITLRGADGINLANNLSNNSGNIFIDADADQGGVGQLTVTKNISTNSGNVTLKGGNSAASGVNVLGNLNVGTGILDFSATAGTFAGKYRIGGTVTALNNFTIADNVTLGGSGTIQTTGTLGFGGIVTVETGSNLTLTATSYSIAQAINGNGSNITLKPANVTDNLQLGTGGSGTNVGPVLSQLNNFNNVTIGGSDLQGKITLSGAQNVNGRLTILAGGVGGNIDVLDGTTLTGSSDLIIRSQAGLTSYGTANLNSTSGKVSLVTDGNVNFSAGTRVKAATFAELSVGGVFTNGAGPALFDPATPYWRVYIDNAGKLAPGGFDLTQGFHRYGCTWLAGCAASTTVPGTGNGFLFKDVPILALNPNSGMITYGTTFPSSGFGVNIDSSGLINGDTLTDAGITGQGSAVVNGATYSTGNKLNTGSYTISGATGTLLSSMGYKFQNGTNASLTVDKAVINNTLNVASKVYDGNTNAAATASLTGTVTGDAISATVSGALFGDKNVANAKTVNATATLVGADAANYTFSNGTNSQATSGTGNITPRTLTATIAATDKTYNSNTAANVWVNSVNSVVSGDNLNINVINGTFANKNAGTGKTVTGTLTLSGTDAANYVWANNTVTTTANINKATITPNAVFNNKTYDGTTIGTLSSHTLGGLYSGDNLTANFSSILFNNKNAANGINVTSNVTLSGTDLGNYQLSSSIVSALADIYKKTVTVGISPFSKTYDGTTNATGTATSSDFINGDSVTANLSGATFDNKNVGTNKTVTGNVNLTGTDATNYNLNNSTASGVANITAKTINAAMTANSKTYDATTTAITTVSTLDLISGDNVTIETANTNFDNKNVGTNKTVTGTASLTGTDAANYVLANSNLTASGDITAKILSTAVTAANKTYDGTTVTTATAGSSDIISGDTVNVNVTSANFTNKDAGTAKKVAVDLTLSGIDAGNYMLAQTTRTTAADIAQKSVTVSVTPSSKTYDGTTTAAGLGSSNDFVSGDSVGVDLSTVNFDNKNVGTNKTVTGSATLSGTDAGNYSITNATVSGTASITAKTVNATATASNKVYDGTTTANASANSLDLISGDNISINATNANFNNKNVGLGKSVSADLSLAGTDAGNYVLAQSAVTTAADITAKTVSAVASAAGKTYDATTATTATVASSDFITGDNVSINSSGANFSDKNAGINKKVFVGVALSGTDASNYILAQTTITTAADISQKSISAAVTTNDKIYNGLTTATTSANLTGTITGDDITANVTASDFADKNVGMAKNVTTTVGLNGNDAGNYALNQTTLTSTANIDKRTVSATISGGNKTYDGNTVATVSVTPTTGFISGDDLSINATSNFSDKNVGTGKAVTNNLSLVGTDAANYSLANSVVASSADITKKTLNAVMTTDNKVYDGLTGAVSVGNSLDIVSGDDITVNTVSSNFTDKNAGIGKTVNTVVSLSGTDIGNYDLVAANLTSVADIAQKGINAAITAGNKIYDGSVSASASGTTSGVIAGDDVTATVIGANFTDKNAGTGKTVNAVISITGTDAGNYTLSATNASTTADIAKKMITNTGINTTDKVYDGSASAIGNSFANTLVTNEIISGDDLTSVVNAANYNDKNVGTGKVVNATLNLVGTDANNYQLASSNTVGAGNIIPRTIQTANASVVDKVYDGLTAAQIVGTNLQNTVANDNISVSATGQFIDKNAGSGKPVSIMFTLSGEDAKNYTLASLTGNSNGNITPRPLGFIVSGNGQPTYLAGGNPMPTGFNTQLTNLISGDSVNSNGLFFFNNGKIATGNVPGQYSLFVTGINGIDANNYIIDYNGLNAVVNAPQVRLLPLDNPTSQANLTEVRQLENYVPVYANGRGVDNRARITSFSTIEEDESDSMKGFRASAVGTRTNHSAAFSSKQIVKEVEDEMQDK